MVKPVLRAQELEGMAVWLAEQGLPESGVEVRGETLLVKLSPAGRRRLFADNALREALVRKGRELDFSRVAVEIESP